VTAGAGRLAGPGVRLGAGLAGLAATAMSVRRDRVGPREAQAFRMLNGLPDALFLPSWPVMQLGNLAAAPASAGVAFILGERRLAKQVLVGGIASWSLSKVVKRGVRRPRPSALLPEVRRRGQEAVGLGFLSGHAAVAVSLGVAALPRVHGGARVALVGAVPIVGLARIYVGAHLPLDVVGGAALGLAVEGAIGLFDQATDRRGRLSARPPRGSGLCSGATAVRRRSPGWPW
jgi:membrane-associated phospholipid phosphatase